jgi:TolA-binding protein
MRPLKLACLTALALIAVAPADAQRRQPTPEERIERLEKQVRQVQKQVFPKGQPADTAGFSDEPAATLTQANQLSNRLDAIEQAMAQITRASEENGNRLATMEAELARLRADQDRRLRALETNGGGDGTSANDSATGGSDPADDQAAPADTADAQIVSKPLVSRPKVEKPKTKPTTTAAAGSTKSTDAAPSVKPGDANFDTAAEEAYDRGFQLWNTGRYDEAITTLRAFSSSFPGHRRVSWANNLIGRSLLDKGQNRAAAEALLANYRTNPKGERAPDSLYYLGQALMKLGQPTQACKAYSELDEVYGPTMRAELKKLLPAAKAAAKCS